MPTGIILKGIGGFYYVKTCDGVYECKARGVFRKDDLTPLPGDRVNISVIEKEKMTGSIDEILPRDSQLVRPAVANVDQIIVVIAVKSPSPDFILLDKLLIAAEINGVAPIICINKADLDVDGEHHKIIEAYEKTGYKIVLTSAKMDLGFDELKELLTGHITTFAGQSGVGKSTMLNKVMQSMVMETGEISMKIERGRHTTRHAELIELESGGFVVDTPGFSSFELKDIKHDELELFYPEFGQYRNKCRFTGCSHISEPECSIKEALNAGLISYERYTRYVQFYNELRQINPYKEKNKTLKRK